MGITDLHNHTIYSYDGSNTPEEIIENAIDAGIDVIGITDHQFSVRERFFEYVAHIGRCQEKYHKHIKVLCGLEIGTRPKPLDFLSSMSEKLDYCLFESLDSDHGMDFYEFLEWSRLFRCKRGLAHTDIFLLSERYGINILKTMKEYDLFWELNISGNYVYYYDFLTNDKKRNMVRESNIQISIGSDTHWIGEFDIGRIKRAHKLVENMGRQCIFSDAMTVSKNT
ncbi:MAG: PHP domain-containing protein [Clostridia bacterium]|nr:PHP domain-containing protein [Clostridia bacterium]